MNFKYQRFSPIEINLDHFDISYDAKGNEVFIESKPEFIKHYENISLKYSYKTAMEIDKTTGKFKDNSRAKAAFTNSITSRLSSRYNELYINKSTPTQSSEKSDEKISEDDFDFSELDVKEDSPKQTKDEDFNFDEFEEIPILTDIKKDFDDDFNFDELTGSKDINVTEFDFSEVKQVDLNKPEPTPVDHEQTISKAFIYHIKLESDFEELEAKYLQMKCDLEDSKSYLKDLKAEFKELRKNK